MHRNEDWVDPGVPTPASLLPVWLWALLNFLSLSFLTCKMRMIIVLRRVAVQVKQDLACEGARSRYSADSGCHFSGPSQVQLFAFCSSQGRGNECVLLVVGGRSCRALGPV